MCMEVQGRRDLFGQAEGRKKNSFVNMLDSKEHILRKCLERKGEVEQCCNRRTFELGLQKEVVEKQMGACVRNKIITEEDYLPGDPSPSAQEGFTD